MIKLWADMELKDTIVKPPRCACCKVFGHIPEEFPKNPGLGVVKNLKKPSQASRGISVGPKVGFKPAKEYRPILKKPTNNTSDNKKKGAEPTKEANASGSSLWNVETSSTSITPFVDKIGKFEKLIIQGKVTLVHDDGKPLKKVDYLGDHDSEDEVKSVDNDMTHSMATERNMVYPLNKKVELTLSEALVKKQTPFGVSDDMSRTYTSFLLRAISTICLFALEISLEKLLEELLVEVRMFEVLILILWKTQASKLKRHKEDIQSSVFVEFSSHSQHILSLGLLDKVAPTRGGATLKVVINMPRATVGDTSRTKSYIPKVSEIPGFSPVIAQFYKPIENRCIHEGRVVDQLYFKSNGIERMFTNVRFNCLFEINEPIVPRFILDFYSQVKVQTDEHGYLLLTPDDIRRFLQIERVDLNRTSKSQSVVLTPNQILTKELRQDMRRWEELIRENVFGLGGNRDHLPACLAYMLYCIIAEEQYNLTYFFVKRIECARSNPTANLPYSMFSTRLYRHIMEHYPHLDNDIYNVVDRVMHDDEDDGASRDSTPSPNTYLNSLKPLDHQQYDIPISSEQDDDLLFERQTDLINQTQQMHKELRGGFKSFGMALRGVFGKKKK
ncbi:hypothetical protein Tco_0298702 [Tanacetum coccineum]